MKKQTIFIIIVVVIVLFALYFLFIKEAIAKKRNKIDISETNDTATTIIYGKQKPPFTGVVTASVLNVRAEPNTSSNILTKLKKGREVYVEEKVGSFYKISLVPLYKKVYIHSNYIKAK